MCRETCSDVFAPVCGNDGVTYSSECELRVSSCTQQRRIVVSRQGPCDVQDPCETKDCRFGSFCSTSFDGRTAQCVCPDKCPVTPGERQTASVCGSDGRNYQNECELLKVSCREMRAIEIKFKGVCDPCEGVECPTSQTCQLDDLRKPVCRCNSVCSPDFRPVCGSDGKTYTNECTMRVEACKSRKSIRIIYTGECSSGANPCDSLQCGPYQTCDIDHQGKATCQCEDTCEPVVRLVCGSDGLTHPNECEMRREGCLQKRTIKLLYRGECGERGPCYRYHCSYGAICVVKGGFPTCECPTCAEEFEPVCGTDGISYTNHCKLKRESCEQKSEIAVAYTGLCTGCENKRCEYYAVCESDGRGNGKCVCPESCIQVESLVCGTDEVTYLNECEMRVAACKKAQYVMVVSKGPCDLCQGVHCKYGARCEEGRCVCPTDCPQADEVVCANDGTTYRNECEMRGAACRHDQELNVLFYGECDEVGETQDEGSGMEADCHERTCRYGGVCEYDSEGMPYCACAFRCPVVFDPVCGSDGRLHDNECKLKEESCRQQKNLMPVHIEMCEEFREVPCDGEVPLMDPMTNKDYYCGDEIGAKLCPPGSYCHKSTAFSKCCREVILIRTCSESTYGCCPDAKTAAQGPNNAGCPSVCNCNRLGSYGLTCEPTTNQCFCKPGVGGPRCDRCEPGYWGLHRMTSEEDSDGCSPCACNLYGSVRDDCEQMTGRCVCKQGILGMKCDACPVGMVLGPDGCIDESIAQPVSGSCDDLVCYHGAVCREKEGDMAQCVCEPSCSSQEDHKGEPVCASDGNTYGSECQMEHFACRYQTHMMVTKRGPCEKGPASKLEKEIILRKATGPADLTDNHLLTSSRQIRHLYNKTSPLPRHSKNRRGAFSAAGFSVDGAHSSMALSFKVSHLVPFGRISVDVEFVPHGKDGVVFYCGSKEGNSTVALFLLIRNQFLELRVHGLNENFTLHLPRRLEIGRQHRASVRRLPHVAALHLDRKWTALRSCVERYHMATFPYNFVVGAVPEPYGRYLEEGPKLLPFIGCILQLTIGKHDLSLSQLAPQRHPKGVPVKRNSSLSASKEWYAKKNVRKGTCFRDKKDYRYRKQQRRISAHRALSRTDVPERLDSLLIAFRMFIRGELFTWRDSSREVRVEVDDGRVELSVVCDGGERNLTFKRPVLVDDEKAHRMRFYMMRSRLEVFLDDTSKTLLLPKSCSYVFVGGQVSILGQSVVPETLQEDKTRRTFRGCLEELYLSNHIVDLKRILRQNFLCHPS